MHNKEKVMRLLNALGLIDKIRMEINWFRDPMSMMGRPLDIERPKMLDVSKEEEEKIIDEHVNAYCEYLKDINDGDLDNAVDFYESELGKKILNPSREFFKNLANITPRALQPKLEEYHKQWEARRLISHPIQDEDPDREYPDPEKPTLH